MLEFWNKTDSLTLPSGITKSPEEIFADLNFGFTKVQTTLIERTDGITCAIESFSILKNIYDIDLTLDDAEALDAINDAVYAAQHPEPDDGGEIWDELAAAYKEGVNEI